MTYMSRFKAAQQEERARPQYDPATLIDIIEPQDVRLLTAREKFMIRSMKPPENGKFRRPKKGASLADRLSQVGTSGWKSEPEEEDPDALALRLEHERRLEQQRARVESAKSKTFKLDLSGLSSPKLPESITFRSSAHTARKVIKPQHKLTDGFAFSEDSDTIRHLMREHEAIMSARRPIMSAVTSDHTWLKQNALLAAVERKEQETLREKEYYDLDGRCWPTAHTASANASVNASVDAEVDDLDASLEAAVKSGDRAELSAILKRRQNESVTKSAVRDPYQNASSANIAYMQVQELANSSAGVLTQPKDDPALKKWLNHVCVSYPRGGSVAARLQDSRPPTTLASPERTSESQAPAEQEPADPGTPKSTKTKKKLKPMTREDIKNRAGMATNEQALGAS